MKERPIIFNTENVKAILEDRKTMTRRVIKPQPQGADYWTQAATYPFGAFYPNTKIAMPKLLKCPYGQVGDRLWVRETWRFYDDRNQISDGRIDYKADYSFHNGDKYRWRPSIHMPRWASRITLEITEIRVERLQEITEADVLAEGITVMRGTWQSKKWNENTRRLELTGERHPYTGRYHFEVLWDSLNAKRGYSWESNPWVWVISFKRV